MPQVRIEFMLAGSLTGRSFEPSIRDTRNLIDSSLSSLLQTPPYYFASPGAVLHGCDCPFLDVNFYIHLILGLGYALGNDLNGSPSTLPLHGRVSDSSSSKVPGSSDGYWKTTKWFPSLVQSTAIVECLPDPHLYVI